MHGSGVAEPSREVCHAGRTRWPRSVLRRWYESTCGYSHALGALVARSLGASRRRVRPSHPDVAGPHGC